MSVGDWVYPQPLRVQHWHKKAISDDSVTVLDLATHISFLFPLLCGRSEPDLRELSDEAVAHRIGQTIDQYPFQIRPLLLTGIYRARRNTPGEIFSRASDLWYPPGTAIRNGVGSRSVRDKQGYTSAAKKGRGRCRM
jgi:hypothetical protein